MDATDVFLLALTIALAVAAVMGYFRAEPPQRKPYLVGAAVGLALGLGAAWEGTVSWTLGAALGLGCVVLAPGIARVWRNRLGSGGRDDG